jgi:hypothetical protein
MCSHCLFPACWQVVYGLLTTCYKVVQLNRLVTSCSNNLSTSCEWQSCSNLIKWQHWYNLLTSLLQACCEHILLTSCEIFTCACFTPQPQNTTQKSIPIAFCVSSIRHDSSLSKYRKQKQTPPGCAPFLVFPGGTASVYGTCWVTNHDE